jgi:hypothetical protein
MSLFLEASCGEKFGPSKNREARVCGGVQNQAFAAAQTRPSASMHSLILPPLSQKSSMERLALAEESKEIDPEEHRISDF